MEVSQDSKNRTTIWASNPTPEYISEKIQKERCTPIVIAVLFTIAKIWKQAKCSSTDE